MAYSVDSYETGRYEPSHVDLHYFHRSWVLVKYRFSCIMATADTFSDMFDQMDNFYDFFPLRVELFVLRREAK